MDAPRSANHDQWSKASSTKPEDSRIRSQAWTSKRPAPSFKLDKLQAVGYYEIMTDKEEKEKEELIEELEGIIKANKDNMYCDKYQIQDMIEKAFKMYVN